MGWPSQSSCVVGKLVPLGREPNQTLFVYVGAEEPKSIPLLEPNEGVFCNTLDYLSPFVQSFVQKYFLRCHWKGYDHGCYEQGPRYMIDIYYQLLIDKIGLGYKEKKNQYLVEIVDIELETLDYEELVQDY